MTLEKAQELVDLANEYFDLHDWLFERKPESHTVLRYIHETGWEYLGQVKAKEGFKVTYVDRRFILERANDD